MSEALEPPSISPPMRAATMRASSCSSSRLDHADRLAHAEVAPETLLDASRVVLDHRVGGVEDALRGAVVLLQAHHARVREVALEVEDVADVGAAPGVDGLVDVAHDEDVAVRVGEQAHDAVLRVVRVLVLVDEQVVERALPALAHVVEALQQVDAAHQQVVEVHRVGGVQAALVELEDVGHDLLEEVADVLAELRRPRRGGSSRTRCANGCRAAGSAWGRARAPRGRP